MNYQEEIAQPEGLNIELIKGALLKRFWYIVLPFFVVSMATIIYCIKAPRIYESSTVILVQPQEVPADYVKSTVTTDATLRLNTIREQIMSRPRLTQLIEKFKLYPDVLAKGTMYDAVVKMRKNIELKLNDAGGKGRGDSSPVTFEVIYQGEEPEKVRNVVDRIAYLFIEDDLSFRENLASGTSKFLDRELEKLRDDLRQKEERVRQFKEGSMGQLPEQMQNNYQILAQLQQQLDSVKLALQKTEDRKVLLRGQLSTLETLPPAGGLFGALAPLTDARGRSSQRDSLSDLKQDLDALRSRYSDKHPDVLKLKARIAAQEELEKTRSSEPATQETATHPGMTDTQRLILSQKKDFAVQMELIEKEIASYKSEEKKINAEIASYRRRIEDGPRVEQMFVDLRRGYEEASANYQSLLQKKLQAELSESLERTRKGEQFRILESARKPEKPIKPNIMKVLPIGLIAALVCGLGLALLREGMDRSFSSLSQLEKSIESPFFIMIPVIESEAQRRRALVKRYGGVCAIVVMTAVMGYSLFVLWKSSAASLMAGL